MRFSPKGATLQLSVASITLAAVVAILIATAPTTNASKAVSKSVYPAPNPKSVLIMPRAGAASLNSINHFIIIYQENWSFDSYYANFPGADGLKNANAQLAANPQIDELAGLGGLAGTQGQQFGSAAPLRLVPNPINTNVAPKVFDANFLNADLTNKLSGLPTALYDAAQFIPNGAVTGDIVHRFHTEQAQINDGKMNKFVSLSDNPGLVLSYYDATNLPEGKLAQQYVMCDNFFHGAFGGSYLNHQWLITGQGPTAYANSTAPALVPQAKGSVNWAGNFGFDANGDPIGITTSLGIATNAGGSLLNNANTNSGQGGSDTQLSWDGIAVNTTQTSNNPHSGSSSLAKLFPNTLVTIGDLMTAKGVSWKWYSGGWNDALAGRASNLFQYHHQPFNYFQNFADANNGGDATTAKNKADHLQDESNFYADLSSGNLPSVSFIKPLGPDNEHPGYASVLQGQLHVAQLVSAIQKSAAWADCAIIITYDEHGGRYDHVPPPGTSGYAATHGGSKGKAGTFDRFGPGVRVPAIIISPFAKRGVVDHTEYDTTSILSTIENRFGLARLGTRDAAVNDLTPAFDFNPPATFGPDADTDGDGFSDSVESLFGSDANNPNSTPLGTTHAPAATAITTISKLAVKLEFDPTKPGSDAYAFAGDLPVASGFKMTAQTVAVNFGGAVRLIKINASGKSSPGDSAIVFGKTKDGATSVSFVAKFKNQDVQAALASSGLTNAAATDKAVSIKIDILFSGSIYTQTLTGLKYNAVKDGTGSIK